MAFSKDHVLIVAISFIALSKYAEIVTFRAYLSLACTVLVMIVQGFFVFGYAMDPTWHKWVCKERGGLSIESFKQCPPDRMMANLLVDVAGNAGISLFLACTFSLTSYLEAIVTAVLVYCGSILPNLHHYLWEERPLPLVGFTEFYQIFRRILAVCLMLFFSELFHESLVDTTTTTTTRFGGPKVAAFPLGTLGSSLVGSVRIAPFLLLTVVRLILGFLWYGPIFGHRAWLPAMREFKRNDKWPEMVNNKSNSNSNSSKNTVDMPKLLMIGVLCGQIQSLFLIALENNIHATITLVDAVGFACWLWTMFVLPTVSVDMWEGKGYAIGFVNYSLYLVELVAVSAVAVLFYNSGE